VHVQVNPGALGVARAIGPGRGWRTALTQATVNRPEGASSKGAHQAVTLDTNDPDLQCRTAFPFPSSSPGGNGAPVRLGDIADVKDSVSRTLRSERLV